MKEVCEKGVDGERKTKMKKHFFGCILFSRIVHQSPPAECLPVSIIQIQRESRYGFSYNQTMWYCCLHANMGYASFASLMAWHCHTRWEDYKYNKRISFPDFWLKAFLCGKSGWGNGRTDWEEKGKFNSPEAHIPDLVTLWKLQQRALRSHDYYMDLSDLFMRMRNGCFQFKKEKKICM